MQFKDPRSSVVWWDLGSRQGAPMTGLWVYIDGPPDNAILALTLDGRDVISEARVDRMPANAGHDAFDRESWVSAPDQRLHMVRDLAAKHLWVGRPVAEVIDLIGAPGGQRILLDSPWELKVDCPTGYINWDVFFYWPTKAYPNHIYGGSVERINDWAYVHE
jgi:hypothetical protein